MVISQTGSANFLSFKTAWNGGPDWESNQWPRWYEPNYKAND